MHQDDEYNKSNDIPAAIRQLSQAGLAGPVLISLSYTWIVIDRWLTVSTIEDSGFAIASVLLWGGLAFGIYKYSRVCAITALLLYFVDQLGVELVPPGRPFSIFWLSCTFALMMSFSSGIMGCWQRHKYKKTGVDGSVSLNKRVSILTAIVFVLFHSGILGMKYVQKYTREALWKEFYQQTLSDAAKFKFPIKLSNNISFTDIYFEEHTLILEHQVTRGKLAELPVTDYYQHARKLYLRFCADGTASALDLKMIARFAQGYETRDLTFTVKDCEFQ